MMGDIAINAGKKWAREWSQMCNCLSLRHPPTVMWANPAHAAAHAATHATHAAIHATHAALNNNPNLCCCSIHVLPPSSLVPLLCSPFSRLPPSRSPLDYLAVLLLFVGFRQSFVPRPFPEGSPQLPLPPSGSARSPPPSPARPTPAPNGSPPPLQSIVVVEGGADLKAVQKAVNAPVRTTGGKGGRGEPQGGGGTAAVLGRGASVESPQGGREGACVRGVCEGRVCR